MEYKDYYKTLGVAKNASQEEISKRFRDLARQYHPDVNPGDKNAEEKFKEINEAYQVLSDPEKRQKYNQFGQQWQQYARGGGRPEDFDWGRWGTPGSGGRTMNMQDLEELFGRGGGGGFSDFFEALFGGAMGGAQPRARRGQDIEHAVQITLEEAFHGTGRTFQHPDGSRFEVKIPAGVKEGARIRYAGKGGPGANPAEAGSLYLKVQIQPHSRFTRRGDDLETNLPVDLYTAILGGEVEVPTLEKPVRLKIPAHTQNGQSIRLRGLGMPHLNKTGQRGDLFVKIDVQLPANLNAEEKRLFEQLRSLRKG